MNWLDPILWTFLGVAMAIITVGTFGGVALDAARRLFRGRA